MPQEQTGIDYLLETLGQGAAGGVQGALENFYKQREEQKKTAQFEKAGIPKEYAQLDPSLIKELMKQKRQENLFSKVFGKENNNFLQDKIEDTQRNLSEDEILAIATQDPNLARIMQSQKKMRQQENLANRKETGEIRKDYAKKGQEAQKSIHNKDQMLALIKKGNLNHPLVAGIANILPFNADQFLLSDDSQLYRSLMFENFGILKSMFPGQIRVKEIELLEDKLAGLEKNDSAKKKILENQMNAAKADIIRSKAASEVEKKFPYLGIGEFEVKVEELAAPELKNLYDDIIKNYEKIADEYGESLEKLPPASQAKGKTFQDSNTGKKYTSDGKKWKIAR